MKKFSKLMSYLLRHCPEEFGLTMDEYGWVRVDELVQALTSRHPEFTIQTLEEVVATNDKKRFEYDVTGELIRACQGHSISVDLQLKPMEPPDVLWHGTTVSVQDKILAEGIKKVSRHAVHLSEDKSTALMIGRRHGSPVVFAVMAKMMWKEGYTFTKSTNGVWLTDYVPAKSLTGPFYDALSPSSGYALDKRNK